MKDSVLTTLTIIKAINHFSNVFFLAPATSIFTRSIKICLLFTFSALSGLKKTKQKSSKSLIICNMYSYFTQWDHSERAVPVSWLKIPGKRWAQALHYSVHTFVVVKCIYFTSFVCACVHAMEMAHRGKCLHSTNVTVLPMTSQRHGN